MLLHSTIARGDRPASAPNASPPLEPGRVTLLRRKLTAILVADVAGLHNVTFQNDHEGLLWGICGPFGSVPSNDRFAPILLKKSG
jgi:hypothetical protein